MNKNVIDFEKLIKYLEIARRNNNMSELTPEIIVRTLRNHPEILENGAADCVVDIKDVERILKIASQGKWAREVSPELVASILPVYLEGYKDGNLENKRISAQKDVKRREKFRATCKKQEKKGFGIGVGTGLVSTVLAIGIVSGISNSINNQINKDIVNEYTKAGSKGVIESTYLVNNNRNYDYHYHDIALAISTGDFDAELYGAYKRIGWDLSSKVECMNKVIYSCKCLGLCDDSDFVEYCTSKGFVNNDGDLDLEAYEKGITEYILQLNERKKNDDAISLYKRK